MTLTIENIAFERNFQYLFHTVNMNLHTGECLQIQGFNGSGKSTLMRIIAGYFAPHAGQILWNNQCIVKHRDHYQSQLHYIGHQNGIKLYLTVSENIKLFFALTNQKINRHKIIDVLKKMDLFYLLDKQAHSLSAGQLRRLALSRLLLSEAPLWIMDEPTTALDHQGQELFFHLLKDHLTHNGMAIITTHHTIPLPIHKTIQLSEYHV